MNVEHYSNRADAEAAGYVAFNSGPHLAIDIDKKEWVTITVRSGNRNITFAFCPPARGEDHHQCVDVVVHRDAKTEQGNSIQRAAFLGEGPTNAVCGTKDKSPTTIVSVSLLE